MRRVKKLHYLLLSELFFKFFVLILNFGAIVTSIRKTSTRVIFLRL